MEHINEYQRVQSWNVELVMRGDWYDATEAETLADISSQLWHLWWEFADSSRELDCTYFYSSSGFARYIVRDPANPDSSEEIHTDSHGDARVAIANIRFFLARWENLLGSKCWSGVATYPPPAVVSRMTRNEFVAYSRTREFIHNSPDDGQVIEQLEKFRKDGVAILRPILAMFAASLNVAGFDPPPRPPVQYDYTGYSKAREKQEWLRVLKQLGHEMSDVTFKSRRDKNVYIEHEETKKQPAARMCRLLISSLPAGYSDAL